MAHRTHTRSDRHSEAPPKGELPLIVTGICGRLGKRLARALHRDRTIVGIDRRPFLGRPKDIVHHQVDLRRKKTRDVFRAGAAGVVHLGAMHDPRISDAEHHSWNVVGFQRLLDYVAQYEIPKLIVLSGSAVYGPRPDNPQFLTEDSPLLGGASFSQIRDLIEVDMLAQSFLWKNPSTETVILRPVHILGNVANAVSNYLRLPRIPTLLGFDPMVQVIHQNDVIAGIVRALRPGVRGVFNLAGPPPVPLSRLVKMSGRSRVRIPHPVAHFLLNRLWQYGFASFPPPELDHLRYVCMVDDAKIRTTLGYEHRYDVAAGVEAVFSDE